MTQSVICMVSHFICVLCFHLSLACENTSALATHGIAYRDILLGSIQSTVYLFVSIASGEFVGECSDSNTTVNVTREDVQR